MSFSCCSLVRPTALWGYFSSRRWSTTPLLAAVSPLITWRVASYSAMPAANLSSSHRFMY